MNDVPIVGQIYACFDDGKIRHNRIFHVEVLEVIPFNEASEELIEEWEWNKAEYDWIFLKETDYFVVAVNTEFDEKMTFARTDIYGFWYTFENGFCDNGILDVDGELLKSIE